jgi:Mor family transcriptional regulator
MSEALLIQARKLHDKLMMRYALKLTLEGVFRLGGQQFHLTRAEAIAKNLTDHIVIAA